MIIYKTLNRWDADMTFKNEAEYEAFRAKELAVNKIHAIETKITKETKILNNPKMTEYIEETQEIIDQLNKDLVEWINKKADAEYAMETARKQPEEYGKL